MNLSAELLGHELQLNVVAWNKNPAAVLDRALQALSFPPLPMELVVFERRAPTSAAGRPNWGAATFKVVVKITDADLRSGGYALWRERWHSNDGSLLAFHLRRTWSRAEVLGRRERIVEELAGDVSKLVPWLETINSSR